MSYASEGTTITNGPYLHAIADETTAYVYELEHLPAISDGRRSIQDRSPAKFQWPKILQSTHLCILLSVPPKMVGSRNHQLVFRTLSYCLLQI